MSRQQENRMLRHLHRGFIAGLSMLGMLLDGAQLSDLFLQGAALIWLWSPELHLLESACWRRLHRRGARAALFHPAGRRGSMSYGFEQNPTENHSHVDERVARSALVAPAGHGRVAVERAHVSPPGPVADDHAECRSNRALRAA